MREKEFIQTSMMMGHAILVPWLCALRTSCCVNSSAIDRADVMFSGDSVTLSLPVSKTDWQAKGCIRTWSYICDRSLPCPFHILQEDCRYLDSSGAPLFPDQAGGYWSKTGVVQTIRLAAQMAGMEVTDAEGGYRLSGQEQDFKRRRVWIQ